MRATGCPSRTSTRWHPSCCATSPPTPRARDEHEAKPANSLWRDARLTAVESRTAVARTRTHRGERSDSPYVGTGTRRRGERRRLAVVGTGTRRRGNGDCARRGNGDSPSWERRLAVVGTETRRGRERRLTVRKGGDSRSGCRGACCSRPGPPGTGPRPSLRPRLPHQVGLAGRGEAVDGGVAVQVGRERVALRRRCDGVLRDRVRPQRRVDRAQIRARSTLSIARPNAEEICSRLAMRRMSVERLVPAPWKTAGLKNAASPRRSGSCTWCSSKYSWKSGRFMAM